MQMTGDRFRYLFILCSKINLKSSVNRYAKDSQWMEYFPGLHRWRPTASNLITSTKALQPTTMQHLDIVFTRLHEGSVGVVSINVLTKADLTTSHPPDRFIMEAIG